MSRITVHVLSHGVRINALGSNSVRNRQSEGASCHANSQPADGQGDHENKPARMLVTRESQVF